MAQSLILYSEVIPTILAIISLYFLFSGILDHKRTYSVIGVFLFAVAVFVPFAILTNMI